MTVAQLMDRLRTMDPGALVTAVDEQEDVEREVVSVAEPLDLDDPPTVMLVLGPLV